MYTFDGNDLIRKLGKVAGLGKELPFVAAKTLTNVGQMVKKAETEKMNEVFDRPTPYTLRSLYLRPARKDRLESVVWFNEFGGKGTPATRYILPQVEGGQRRLKRSERALQRIGRMPAGWHWVPGRGAKLDRYGNISAGQITQILSVLGGLNEVGFQGNRTGRSQRTNRKPRDYFAIMPQGNRRFFSSAVSGKALHPGVYQALPGRILPILIFVKDATYRKRLPFYEVGHEVIQSNLARVFRENAAQVLSR